ncbi:hypothetical protein KY290_030976 [Solanum tuberosum]|uniref:Uncharacterized protein n=1 Tax=Solanum tuberosum TaxID=4113 RepID=A0ABQ7U9N8_SOLTU|nr:hypothetical protein KY290_030976 [Solanum tuberosum]
MGVRTIVKEVEIFLDEETLGIILGVPMKGIRSIKGCKPSSEFTKQATKRGDIKCASLPKIFLKGEYQLMFEFINKVLVPRTEKRTVASDVADLVMTWKLAKHGIHYGYLLNHVFKHFEVPLGRGVPGTMKQMFTVVTLLECECVEGKANVIVNDKEVEIAQLKFQLQRAISKRPSTNVVDKKEVEKLRAENEKLLKTNVSLSEEFKALNKQIIQLMLMQMSGCTC